MAIEIWAGVAALLFALAALSSGLARSGRRGPWRRMVVAARLGGLIPLAAGLGLAVAAHGEPSPFDLRQVALALALGLAVLGLGQGWRRGLAGTGLVQDVAVLSLVLAGALAIRSGGTRLSCPQRWLPFWTYWGLLILGSSSILLAGSAALDLALRALLPGSEGWAGRADLWRLLANASLGGLVTLGAGLVGSAWWSWHTLGSLAAGDPRQPWMGATWLVAGMSLLAWQTERRPARMAAILAVLAAGMALLGLLAVPELQRLWAA